MKLPLIYIALAFALLVSALTPTEMAAVEQFLSSTETVGTENGPTNEEIAHDLAVGLGLHNSARLLYKYSPDAAEGYSVMYDSLLFIYTGSFTTQAQKKVLSNVIKYFEKSLLK
ncbi:hypothetical protein H4R20_004386 [Coemansia guatemalensis]|uniref:Uncharacterized protein n=1 Tax=Coemansia guatemalensis TaxID=2761395 RepID=A0A9W8LS45_9FUNG|nr:hypothetical protein H4R20_004386 [Coemansia guatemalensis]